MAQSVILLSNPAIPPALFLPEPPEAETVPLLAQFVIVSLLNPAIPPTYFTKPPEAETSPLLMLSVIVP